MNTADQPTDGLYFNRARVSVRSPFVNATRFEMPRTRIPSIATTLFAKTDTWFHLVGVSMCSPPGNGDVIAI